MGFWSLFEVASMPILQVLLISGLGAFMATGWCNLLPSDARRSINKIVFVIFTPCLMFASLAKTVTFQDIISWWFMPLNVGFTFLFGGILGWIAVKLLKPEKYLEGLIIAVCSSGNLGSLMLIIVPAICNEKGSPFGDHTICRSTGLSYASFSMAIGGIYIWTYTYQLIRTTVVSYKELQRSQEGMITKPNGNLDSNQKTYLLNHEDESKTLRSDAENPSAVTLQEKDDNHDESSSIWRKMLDILVQLFKELLSPPTLGAIIGFIFGSVTWLKSLIIGSNAPLHVIQDSIQLLGDGTIPCIILLLGGNLIEGLKTGRLKLQMIIGVLVVRYLLLPVIGVGVVKLASHLGFLPRDPLYHFVLMIQYTLPPAMNIGTMTQLFDVGQDECSVLYLWTYLVAAFTLTFWATAFMWILA